MKIALFGGTFDPIHWGHLLLAESAREAFHLDRVIFVPVGTPPHKHPAVASAAQRLKMVQLAIRGNSHFQASSWEIQQRRVVYTWETLAHFHQQYPRARLHFIVGTDMLATLPQWVRGATLLDQATFLGVERPDYPYRRLPAALRRRARRVPSPAVPFASHEIRKRIRHGLSIRYHVADPVERYIRERRLYR